MSSFTYENQGSETYLVCKIDPSEKVDSSILGMLTNNTIDGIVPTTYTQIDDTRILKYNITSKVSFTQISESNMTKKRVLSIFSEIIKAIKSAEEYMIDESCFLINKDYIFTDISDNKTELICLPVENAKIDKEDLSSFFKNILFNAKFSQDENNSYVTTMINYLNTADIFSIDDFYKLIQTINIQGPELKKVAKAPESSPTPSVQKVIAPPITNTPKPVVPEVKIPDKKNTPEKSNSDEKPMSLFYLLQHYNSENKRIYDEQKNAKKALKDNDKNTSKQKKKSKEKKNTSNPVVPNIAIPGQPVAPVSSSKSDNDSYEEKENALQPETTSNSAENVAAINNTPFDFGSIDNSINSDFDEGTVVIGEETAKQQSCAYLLRIKTNEQIYITKSSFKIGRNNELIDYDLKDNKYVGRLHCHFIIRDNQYYIVDDNSRNHTYLDNVMLTGSVEVEVKHGQRIKIADEDFEFRMY